MIAILATITSIIFFCRSCSIALDIITNNIMLGSDSKRRASTIKNSLNLGVLFLRNVWHIVTYWSNWFYETKKRYSENSSYNFISRFIYLDNIS